LAWSCFFQPFEGRNLQPTLGLDELIFDVCAQTFKLDAEIAQKNHVSVCCWKKCNVTIANITGINLRLSTF
jgi:hypothetical protein